MWLEKNSIYFKKYYELFFLEPVKPYLYNAMPIINCKVKSDQKSWNWLAI